MFRMTILGLGAFLILGTSDLQAQVHPDRRAAQARREAVQTRRDQVTDRRRAQARSDAVQTRREAVDRRRRIRANQR